MSTLAEIEAAAAELTVEEMDALERRLRILKSARRAEPPVFTGRDAVRWWTEFKHLPAEEADAFASDVEKARLEMNRPPTAPTWA